jgi:hypothetical protein
MSEYLTFYWHMHTVWVAYTIMVVSGVAALPAALFPSTSCQFGPVLSATCDMNGYKMGV